MKKLALVFMLFCSTIKAQSYKTYVANLQQSFTNPPFAVNVIKNTLGGTPTFTRNSAGNYGFQLTGAFPIDRTVVFIQSTIYGWAACYRISDNEITIETREVSFGINSIDNYLNATAFEVRVYDLFNVPSPIRDTIVTLTSAQLLNIFTSPVTIIPSPGAGNTIELVSVTDKLIYNTTTYTGNQTLVLKTNTANGIQATLTVLQQTANCKHLAPITAPSGQQQLIANQPLIATTLVTNPGTGDSSIELHVYFRINPY